MPKDYYQLLGVPKNADIATIKQAYRRQIARHHPDRSDNDENARLLNLAYETLKDAERRANYDDSLNPWTSMPTLAAQTLKQAGEQAKRAWKFFQHNLQKIELSSRLHDVWKPQKSANYPVCYIDLNAAYFGAQVSLQLSGRAVVANIPKGVTDGEILRIRADQHSWLVKVCIKEPSVRVEGYDVHYFVCLNNEQVAQRAPILLPEPFSLRLFVPKQSNYPCQICLTGKGIPCPDGAGDLYVHLSLSDT